MNNELKFPVGMCMGIVILTILIFVSGLTPKHQQYEDQQEAVRQGHAHWKTIVNTNGSPPETKFEWNQPCNK